MKKSHFFPLNFFVKKFCHMRTRIEGKFWLKRIWFLVQRHRERGRRATERVREEGKRQRKEEKEWKKEGKREKKESKYKKSQVEFSSQMIYWTENGSLQWTMGSNGMKSMDSFNRQNTFPWASKQTYERSGICEQSKQWGANREANGPVLYPVIS